MGFNYFLTDCIPKHALSNDVFFLLCLKNVGLVEVFPDYLWSDGQYLKGIFQLFCESDSFVLNFLIRQRFFHFRCYSFDEFQCSQTIQFINLLIWGKFAPLRVFILKEFGWAELFADGWATWRLGTGLVKLVFFFFWGLELFPELLNLCFESFILLDFSGE